jgi:hypothetical protein
MTATSGDALVRRIEQILAEGRKSGLRILAIHLTAHDARLWRRECETLIHAAGAANAPTYRGVPVRGALQGLSVVAAMDRAERRGVCLIAGEPEAELDAAGVLPVTWRAISRRPVTEARIGNS